MIFDTRHHDTQTCLVFDTGSNSVAGSWVRYIPGERPQVLYTHRVSIDIYDDITLDHLLFAVKNALREVLALLVPQAPCAPDRAFVYVSSPWYVAQSRVISYAKRHPFIFTQRFADDLVNKEFEKFKNKEHKEWRKLGDGYVPLEHKTMQVKLNGYTYHNPVGKKTERVELSSFLSMMLEDARDEFERIIHSSFHVDVEFHSAAYATYFGLMHVNDAPDDYVIMDVRGEVSDIVVVRDGHIQEIASLPFGDHTIVRKFANRLDMKPIHMQELLSMYHSNMLEDTIHNRINRAVSDALGHVEKSIEKVLMDIAERGLLPPDMYVYASSLHRDWYHTIFQDTKFSPVIVAARSFKAHDADTALKGFVTDEEVKLDPYIVAGAFFGKHRL